MTNFEKKTGIKPCCVAAMLLLILSVCFNVFLYHRCIALSDTINNLDCAMQREMNIIDTLFNANKDLYYQLKKDDSIILELKHKAFSEAFKESKDSSFEELKKKIDNIDK